MLATVRATSWEEAKLILQNRALWAFRGHSEAAWDLETSIYREAVRNGSMKFGNLANRESWVLYQFRRFAHHHISDLPPDEALLDWLALIQHYGGPTRLVDFSYSMYVAAFFAVESATNDAAVWAVNLPVLGDGSCEQLNYKLTGSIDEINAANNQKFVELVRNGETTPSVLNVEPNRMHQRLWIQQGLFLAPINLDQPFMMNLAATFGLRRFDSRVEQEWTTELNQSTWKEYGEPGCTPILKVVLPRDIHRDVLDDLHSMNITAATLFPGLDGAARSLRYHV